MTIAKIADIYFEQLDSLFCLRQTGDIYLRFTVASPSKELYLRAKLRKMDFGDWYKCRINMF